MIPFFKEKITMIQLFNMKIISSIIQGENHSDPTVQGEIYGGSIVQDINYSDLNMLDKIIIFYMLKVKVLKIACE